jgi:N6-adenosine-specific RNA methylase IME4
MKKYDIIHADPAWTFSNKNTGGSMKSGASAHYETMSVDQICDLPISGITSDSAILCMWWVGSQPLEALKVMEAWGFRLITMNGFTWVKRTKSWKLWFGMGFQTRKGSENCLFAVKGKGIKPVKRNIRNVQIEELEETIEFVNEKHSKKPDVFAHRIVELFGDRPRVELFARDQKKGWDSWGNEIENSIQLV